MKIDIATHPIVWLRDHAGDHPLDDEDDRRQLVELIARGERFVLVSERMPTLIDLADAAPQEKKVRAEMLKSLRGDISRLCAGAIVIGSSSSLPLALRKALEGLTATLGVPLAFAEAEADALHIASRMLGGGRENSEMLQS